jgi:hypothetical protein
MICLRMAATKLEAGLASAGLIILGVLGYFLLRGGDDAARPETLPQRQAAGQAERAAPSPVPAGAGIPGAVTVRGTVRDLLTDQGVAGASVRFQGRGDELAAASDATGAYATALAPGRYRVRVQGDDVAAFDDAWLAIEPGAGTHDFDIHVLRLARIEGRVVDGAGESLEGVNIGHRTVVLDRALDQDDTAPHGSAISGAGGGFSVRVPPGQVELVARAQGRPESTTIIRWVPPGAHLTGVEIVMDAGATVAGTVIDPAGAIVAGAQVIGYGSEQREVVRAQTGADGGFALRALVPGKVHIEAEAPGFARSAVVTVHVEAERPVTGVVVTLQAARVISGRVIAETGEPVAGATVRVEPMMGRGAAVEARTGQSGVFELGGLGIGPHLLSAGAPGFATTREPGVSAPVRELEIVLTRSGALFGRVTARGAPLRAFSVRLQGRSELRTRPSTGPAASDLTTEAEHFRIASADGSYRIEDVRPGTYDVTLFAPGLAPETVLGVTVPAGGDGQASANLDAGASVTGTITSAEDGAPVADVLVRLSTGSESPATYTDARGGFTINDIAPGRRSLEAQHPAYLGKIISGIEVAPGEQERLDMTLQRLAFGADNAMEFAGVGAVISMQEERLVVQALLPHGPAEVAGLLEGDEISHINGKATRGRSLADNIEDIRGVVGTVVRLGVRRDSSEFERDVVRGQVRFTPGATPQRPAPEPDDP